MICVECDSDEAFACALGVAKNILNHASGKGSACNLLLKKRGWVAVLDEDPLSAQPSYLRRLPIKKEENGFRLLEDEKNKHLVVLLCPRLEEWILQTAKSSGIQVSIFGLPSNADGLHEALARRQVREYNLPRMLSALMQNSRIKSLQALLKGKG